jgi:hypothetical protein
MILLKISFDSANSSHLCGRIQYFPGNFLIVKGLEMRMGNPSLNKKDD